MYKVDFKTFFLVIITKVKIAKIITNFLIYLYLAIDILRHNSFFGFSLNI